MAQFVFIHNPLVRFNRLVEQGDDFAFAEICTTIDQITLQRNGDYTQTCFAIIGGCTMRISLRTYNEILYAKKLISSNKGRCDDEYDFRNEE